MTLAANICDRCDPGRRGAVIAVTVVARRSSQILTIIQCFSVNAALVLRVLIGRNFELGHPGGFAVALGARFGDVRRIHGRESIAYRTDAVYAMKTNASVDFLVTRS